MILPPLVQEINRQILRDEKARLHKSFKPVESLFWEYDYYFNHYSAFGITLKPPLQNRSLKFPLLVWLTYSPTTLEAVVTTNDDTIIDKFYASSLSRATYLLKKDYIFLDNGTGTNFSNDPLYLTPTYW